MVYGADVDRARDGDRTLGGVDEPDATLGAGFEGTPFPRGADAVAPFHPEQHVAFIPGSEDDPHLAGLIGEGQGGIALGVGPRVDRDDGIAGHLIGAREPVHHRFLLRSPGQPERPGRPPADEIVLAIDRLLGRHGEELPVLARVRQPVARRRIEEEGPCVALGQGDRVPALGVGDGLAEIASQVPGPEVDLHPRRRPARRSPRPAPSRSSGRDFRPSRRRPGPAAVGPRVPARKRAGGCGPSAGPASRRLRPVPAASRASRRYSSDRGTWRARPPRRGRPPRTPRRPSLRRS